MAYYFKKNQSLNIYLGKNGIKVYLCSEDESLLLQLFALKVAYSLFVRETSKTCYHSTFLRQILLCILCILFPSIIF